MMRKESPSKKSASSDYGVAADGSPVGVYLALPGAPEFDPMIKALPGGARVLDLGCGVGRLANRLALSGHHVVAVDSSPEMLAQVSKRVRTVTSTIEDLRLNERFDAVVLSSNLINTGDDAAREAFVASCARHVASDGRVFIQRYDPQWAATVDYHHSEVGEVAIALAVHQRNGKRFTASVEYALRGEHWRQDFTGCVVDDEMLTALLERHQLKPLRWLTTSWIEAGAQ